VEKAVELHRQVHEDQHGKLMQAAKQQNEDLLGMVEKQHKEMRKAMIIVSKGNHCTDVEIEFAVSKVMSRIMYVDQMYD